MRVLVSRKLVGVEFAGRDHKVSDLNWPLLVSLFDLFIELGFETPLCVAGRDINAMQSNEPDTISQITHFDHEFLVFIRGKPSK
ncbi:hypothetical protein UFOVP2_53, partial [uncultured Caudovirales phage]